MAMVMPENGGFATVCFQATTKGMRHRRGTRSRLFAAPQTGFEPVQEADSMSGKPSKSSSSACGGQSGLSGSPIRSIHTDRMPSS